jgi:hypothetical protein
MRKIEKEEERSNFADPEKPVFHLCIVNLVIGTLYCAKVRWCCRGEGSRVGPGGEGYTHVWRPFIMTLTCIDPTSARLPHKQHLTFAVSGLPFDVTGKL